MDSGDADAALGPVVAGIPMFNEEETIGTVVLLSKQHVDTVICVDDGSSDASWRIAQRCGATVQHHRANRGYGAALRTLFKSAREHDARALVILDSDGQHEADEIPSVIQPILDGDADVVIGSRFLADSDRSEMPRYRRLGVTLINKASNLSSNLAVQDTQSGFRAFSAKALDLLAFDHEGMESTLEVLDQCEEKGLRVREVPISVRYDVPKSSTYSAFGHGFTVLSYALVSLSQKKPLLVFGVPGVGLLASGTAIGMRVLNSVEVLTDGTISLSVGPGLTAAWLGMLGVSFCFTGLVLQGARSLMRSIVMRRIEQI